MIALILLWIAANPQQAMFERHVRDAYMRLQIAAITVEVSRQQPMAAWVKRGPVEPWVIYVRPDFLREADPLALRSVAYHESCHFYLGTSRRDYFRGEESLVHHMVAGCVEWLHGPGFHWAMTQMPCQRWYPSEATNYNRRIGKERCVAKR